MGRSATHMGVDGWSDEGVGNLWVAGWIQGTIWGWMLFLMVETRQIGPT